MPPREMLADVHVTVELDTDVSRFVRSQLFKSNVERTGNGTIEALCVAARGATSKLVGGAYGEVYWGWLNILVLWVTPELRRQGLGTRLLGRVETEAIARGCHGVYLDTFSFQHPALYLRAGYEIFGTLEQFPNGHSRHFLRKRLHAA